MEIGLFLKANNHSQLGSFNYGLSFTLLPHVIYTLAHRLLPQLSTCTLPGLSPLFSGHPSSTNSLNYRLTLSLTSYQHSSPSPTTASSDYMNAIKCLIFCLQQMTLGCFIYLLYILLYPENLNLLSCWQSF